ncbi:replicative DNA helicase [Aetokthonos hydrillicola Thurmond2011]|jgi:replicative DNA helicase|uniref:Replicative DNA helicase n=1 Tax=Aetokthonos hydrillicola Thurmond2011 TaxID=2712845 RepID=A0AAP5M8E7_9CYAN|nr:replicative DNA helicase [Aetokthonos hydrillicola]MBO3461918.1 replicative DNA helicase [Aetokthonos hydrillicola CCALA 1050]MBW4585417.1 replicative DNA helicase [Aetokthonos hydrillicola CCALA 1050]MDR9899076.1 replicative DNA helicase [Aetokthonos hydrillicola Thurmond2011]
MTEELNFHSNSSDQLPPQNIEAEEAILGGILLDPEAISRVSDRLVPEAFYISAHKEIYQAALRLHGQGKPTDLLSLTSWLADQDQLARIGGRNKLASLVDRTVSAINIDALAGLVMEKYLRRRLIKAGNDIVQLGYQTETELPLVLDQAEQKVFGVTQERPQAGLVHISDTLINTFQDIETRHQGIALPGIPCGFYDLDAMTSGFQRSDLVIVAGRPSMGKCVAYDTEIVLADGSICTIEEIFHRRQAELLTLTDDWKFSMTQPSAFVDDGVKFVVRVTTALGRSVETTITHPYLTVKGWQRLEELKVGDKIAVPRKIDVFGNKTIPESEVKFLADSCLTGEKVVPKQIFELERSQVCLFLNRLFGSDKWVKVLTSGKVQLGSYSVSEKLARQLQHLLLRFGIIAALKHTHREVWQLDITDTHSIQILFSEIGIFDKQEAIFQNTYQTNRDLISVVARCDDIKGKNSTSTVERVIDLPTALKNVPLQPAAHRIDDWGLGLGSNYSEQGQNSFPVPSTQSPIPSTQYPIPSTQYPVPSTQYPLSDIYWDEIVSIEPIGYKQVYDLTIPVTHNFVANDICVHNTAFCLNLAHNIASLYKLPVAIFSLEMSKEQLVQRLLASEAGIESGYLRSGRISQNQWEPLSRAIGMLSEMPVFIDDTPNITVTEMRSQARRLQAEIGSELGLIIIDYLQLMEGAGDNRVQELSRITRSIKGLARELSVPIIALSQLSRGVESRTNKRPMLSDLRESGSIEQDADLVIMLYRDEYYNTDTPDRGIAEVIIAKHRNGPTGVVKLLFDPQFTKFKNLAK